MSLAMPSYNTSLWQASADAAPVWDQPDGAVTRVEACIIGGGLAGLTTALLLAEKGVQVLVAEAALPGAAASGRNAGFVVPNLAGLDPDQMMERLGPAAGQRLASAVGKAGAGIFALAKKYEIDCAARPSGWIQPTAFICQQDQLYHRFLQWQRLGQPVEWLDKQATDRITGTSCFAASWLDRSGGSLHPVRYLHGLARAVRQLGGRIYVQMPVHRFFRQQDKWLIDAGGHHIEAERLVVCAHLAEPGLQAQTGLSPLGLEVCQLATKPINSKDAARLTPARQPVSDIRHDIFTFRLDPQNRLITGGMAVWPWEGRAMMARRMLARLQDQLALSTRPQLDSIWTGRAAVTPGFMPQIRKLGPAGWSGLACNGRGLAATYVLAHDLAALAMAEQPEDQATAIPVSPAGQSGFGPLAPLGRQLVLWRGRQQDRWHRIQDKFIKVANSNKGPDKAI